MVVFLTALFSFVCPRDQRVVPLTCFRHHRPILPMPRHAITSLQSFLSKSLIPLQPVSVPIIRSAREALHKELDECDGLRLVDDIHQEGADNGHDHESTSGHAAETETTE